jgi:hypothetical protein
VDADVARRLWIAAEPIHALTYFAPESQQAFEDAGVRGFWRGYFAGRAAPFGVTPPDLVTATFFGFHPAFVARAIPSVWSLIDPTDAIATRHEGVDRSIRTLFGDDFPAAGAHRAATAIRDAVAGVPVDGRPLFAANTALDWPDQAHLALWHATTLLREHRGDGHISALLSAGVGPCEAHVLRTADQSAPPDSIQPHRGWSDADWSAATDRLRANDWLDAAGRPTDQGRRVRAEIERDTDRLSAALVGRIRDRTEVARIMGWVTDRITRARVVPYPNPIGVPDPSGAITQ